MNLILGLLLIQCVLGAYDSLWHHEFTQALPARRSARRELLLHGARELIYAAIFAALAWRELHGLWAFALAVLLGLEILITLADFLEEDRTRRLPRMERVLHTVLALNYGAWLALFAPVLYHWAASPTQLVPVDHGLASRLLALAAVGVLLMGLRNLAAALRHYRPPGWVRSPLAAGVRPQPRRILVTGATGFIGSALVRKLLLRGDAVTVLSRSREKALDRFGPQVRVVENLAELPAAERIDGIVNLAGAGILALPWFRARRRLLLHSRLATTEAVVALCRRLVQAPAVLVSGSAIGFYGVRGEEECDEESPPQTRFQSDLCQQWEALAARALPLGTRVVWLRTGLVLGRSGGALPRLSLPVRLFAGATLGSGRQWMSWIHVADLVRLILFALDHPAVSGPLNGTAPEPVRHGDFQRALAAQLRRPMWMRVPAWVLRLGLGEMAELLADGQRVIPRKALALGFEFRYRTLGAALAALFPRRQLSLADADTEVYFNGDCPVCSAEMSHYAKLSRADGLPLRFVDSMRAPQAFAACGLRSEHLEGRLYLRDPGGQVVSGLEALIRVWQQLPRYRALARAVSLPGVHAVASVLYDLAIAPSLAWYARHRAAAGTRRELA